MAKALPWQRRGRARVVSPDNELLLSAASAWAIAIKHGLGKPRPPEAPEEYIPPLMARTGISPFRSIIDMLCTPPRRPRSSAIRSTGCSSRRKRILLSWR